MADSLGANVGPTGPVAGVDRLAPAGTPKAIIDKLNHAVNGGLRSAEVRASLKKLGTEAKIGTPQDLPPPWPSKRVTGKR